MPDTSEALWVADRPAPGLVVHQPLRGFKYSADAFWLAGFSLESGVPATAVDLGTGSGIVAFLLARAGCQVRGLDNYAGWEPGWVRSMRDSDFAPELGLCDVREATGAAALVTCNPPYFRNGSGPVSTDPFKAVARTEGAATLVDFARAATRIATERIVFVVPAERESTVTRAVLPFRPSRRLAVGRKRVVVEYRLDAELAEDCELDREHPRVRAFTQLG